jgi:hypothetical protein
VLLLVQLLVATALGEEPPRDRRALEERVRLLEEELRAWKAAPQVAPAAPHHAGGGTGPITTVSEGTTRSGTRASITFGGYAEIFYQWNFNRPSNGITSYRGFDNRHNSLTVANAVLEATGTVGPVAAHLALQIGHTPETYYLAEPFSPGSNAAGTSGAAVWKYLQQANLAYTAPLGHGLLIEGGIFLSPIGPEGMAIKDQWNWSRSNLFFGLPFYHTGLRISYPFTDRLTASIHLYNGWNSVVDNNTEKSLAGQLTYVIEDRLTLNAIYFTGVERPRDAPEGRAWRHLFDVYLATYPRKWLALLAHVDGGFEPNALGVAGWAAGALYARFRATSFLYLAARGDFFHEWVPPGGTAISWPSSWMASATATADLRPHDNLSFRVEYRHDHAAGDTFFRGEVTYGLLGTPLPNVHAQDTLTFGAVAWF